MNEKILIIDDAKFARKVLKHALTDGNYTNIVEATTAKDALEIFEKEQPELTLLDISLPDSDDLGLLEKLLALNPQAKIVICSALGQNLIIENAIKMGAKDFITKPFEEKILLEIVNNQLH
ncbi:MAG: response regulator [Lachnospiraceae bacterium]|nr:response regulator [Lachnospiraceae bacterium]